MKLYTAIMIYECRNNSLPRKLDFMVFKQGERIEEKDNVQIGLDLDLE